MIPINLSALCESLRLLPASFFWVGAPSLRERDGEEARDEGWGVKGGFSF